MAMHEITLAIAGDVRTTPTIDAPFEGSRNDATFGEMDGVANDDFRRDASSLLDVVVAAIRQVESVPGLRIHHVEPDERSRRNR